MADNKYAKALLNYVQMPMAQLGAVFGTTPQKMSKALRQEGSNIYESMKSAVTAPGRALQGQMNPQLLMDENGNITQDDSKMNQEAMNFAMNMAGSGLGSSAIKPSPKGSLGMASIPEYGMEHRPPMRESGAPLHDLTGGGNIYPEDVYSNKAAQYYGAGEPFDYETFSQAHQYRNKPDALVNIYRAVPHEPSIAEKIAKIEKDKYNYMRRGTIPKDSNISKGSDWYDFASDELDKLKSMPEQQLNINDINPGDWITINKKYAKEHGESALGGKYKIISKKVKAKDIFTNGDSIHEWGYDPQE